MPGRLPSNGIPESDEIEGGDNETRLTMEVSIDGFGQLLRGGQVDEPIRSVDRSALVSAGVQCYPIAGSEYLVGNFVGHRRGASDSTSEESWVKEIDPCVVDRYLRCRSVGGVQQNVAVRLRVDRGHLKRQ